MKQQSRSLACKAIICVSICLGTCIAFMLFKSIYQQPTHDISTVKEIKPKIASPATDQNSQTMIPTDEELQKLNEEVEAFRLNMTQEQRDEFDRQVEEIANPMGEYSWIAGLTKEELEDYLVNATEEQRKKYEEPIKEFLKSLEEYEESGKLRASEITEAGSSAQMMMPTEEELQKTKNKQ